MWAVTDNEYAAPGKNIVRKINLFSLISTLFLEIF